MSMLSDSPFYIDGLTKEKVEKLVEEKLGYRFDLTHSGNHNWVNSQATLFETCGIFHNVFSSVRISVAAQPCDQSQYPGWFTFGINVGWSYIEGGTNGHALSFFYYQPDDVLLTSEQANERYWAGNTPSAE
jgi:hypothetical protein